MSSISESTPLIKREKIIVSDPTKGVKVDAGAVASPFREEIRTKVEKLKEQGIRKYSRASI